jgi:Cytochrome c7 and related cytochrome c
MSCHESIKTESAAIQKLAQHAKSGTSIEWVRIYTVPDYVWFSHKSHHRGAGLECETCHGPVAEREVIVKEKPTSMAACMDCHAKRRASNDCGFCHNPM